MYVVLSIAGRLYWAAVEDRVGFQLVLILAALVEVRVIYVVGIFGVSTYLFVVSLSCNISVPLTLLHFVSKKMHSNRQVYIMRLVYKFLEIVKELTREELDELLLLNVAQAQVVYMR